MSGETYRIAEIAERLSSEIFKFFRWKTLPNGLMNQNFTCVNKNDHVILKEKQIENFKAEFDRILKNKKDEGATSEEIALLEADQNLKLKEMASSKKEELDKFHPVDAVFFYTDPYTKEKVFFNCDLKSYKQQSIAPGTIRNTLVSLAQTLHCARNSEEWNIRYNCQFNGEVRGLLFLLNHDGKYRVC